MTDLDTLARSATRELLDRSSPDVAARYAELKRVRSRRTAAKLVAVAAAVAIAAGGWQLTGHGGRSVEPAPAPPKVTNGVLLAGPYGLRVAQWVAGDGGELAHVPRDIARDVPPHFSADGSELVYVTHARSIVAFDVRTGEDRVLGPCPSRGCSAVVSPDGTTVASWARNGYRLTSLGSSADRRIVGAASGHGVPSWSRDGNRLAYTASDGVHVVEVDSQRDDLVHTFSEHTSLSTVVSWAPDGSALAFFDTAVLEMKGGRPDHTRFTAMTVQLADEATQVLIDAGHCVCMTSSPPSLTWSPDGSLIAVSVLPGAGTVGVALVRPDGEPVRSVGLAMFDGVAWQPVIE